MRISPSVVSFVALTLTCVVTAAAYYYRSRNTEINEVMLFCKLQYNAYNYFDKLISFIEAAKRNVNVCMPGIHNPAIQGRLVELIMRKNVEIRIIIDQSGYNEFTEVFIKELIDAGAEIRCKVAEPYQMQHKFCLIDDEILMTGTLNWGDDRSSDNWNYVYITSKQQLVDPVKKEFYQMWKGYSNDVLSISLQPVSYNTDIETVSNNEDHSSDESVNQSSSDTILQQIETTTELCTNTET